MRTQLNLPIGLKGTPIKFALAAVIACVLALASSAQSANAAGLPGPTFSNVPVGQVLDTSVLPPIDFTLPNLTGGTLLGFVCTLDGNLITPCDGSVQLANMSAGAHDLAVMGQISVLGSNPVCVLGVCLPAVGPLTLDTDVSHLFLNVESGAAGGSGGSGSNGATGANGTNSSGATVSTAYLAASAALKKQTNRCMKLKRKLRKHFSKRSNRARARTRYLSCVKTQKKLAKRLASMS
jgi:hypothetical protein